jgi:curved DNA-binding protein CbpA
MAKLRNYYRILQVDPCAEAEVITAAYKQLALKYHPDTNQSPDATRKMQELNEAYAVLSEPDTRARYDLELDRQQALDRQAAMHARQWTGQGRPPQSDLHRESSAQTAPGQAQDTGYRARENSEPSRAATGTTTAASYTKRSKSGDRLIAGAWAVSFVLASIILYRLCQLILPSIWSNSPWWWLGLALPPILGVPIAVAVAFRLEALVRRGRRPEPE